MGENKQDLSFLEEAQKMLNEKQCKSTVATVDGVNFFKVGEDKRPYKVRVK